MITKPTLGKWTTEPHGKTTALYSNRTNHFHGLRLMNLDDGDSNFEANIRLISFAPDMYNVLIQLTEGNEVNFEYAKETIRALINEIKG